MVGYEGCGRKPLFMVYKVTHSLLLIWPILKFVPNTSQAIQIGLRACLRTHSVCDGVGVCVSDPGHFPLSCAHVWGGDIDARSW